jgi:hypothetical protein
MATKLFLTDIDLGSAARIVNLQNPVAPGEPATKGYVDSAVEGLAWKDSCRVATQSNTNLSSPGATLDGITLVTNDRVLVRAQTLDSENGIYIWNGAATPMTRALDANTFAELEQAVTTIEEGTSAASTFRQTTVNGTIGSTSVTWGSFGTTTPAATESTAGIQEIATQGETDAGTADDKFITPLKLATYAGRAKRYAVTFGDGSATSYVITHNIGSADVDTQVRETGGNKRVVECEVRETSTNSITLLFNTAPALNSLRVVVQG